MRASANSALLTFSAGNAPFTVAALIGAARVIVIFASASAPLRLRVRFSRSLPSGTSPAPPAVEGEKTAAPRAGWSGILPRLARLGRASQAPRYRHAYPPR